MRPETQKPWDHKKLRWQFNGADNTTYNYAQSDQDIFVLSMLNGLRNGTYLEIGAAWPDLISNTALLEMNYGWTGISIDYVDDYPTMWQKAGRKTLLQGNGQSIDFNQALANLPPVIDYLSLDCDPGVITFEILQRIPFDQYKFRTVTFEHECHCDGPAVKMASRKFLLDLGYVLVADNISEFGVACDYEDWYAHPDLVDPERLRAHQCVDGAIKYYKDYLYR